MKTNCFSLYSVAIASLFLQLTQYGWTYETATIKTILKDRVGDKKGVGIVAGLINEKERQIVSYGQLNEDSSREVDGDTIFEIGSITKVFTALLLADMVERREVTLNAPVSKLLPGSVKTPTKDGKEITLLHLATHTSGLPKLPANLAPKDWGNPYVDYTVEQLYQYLSSCTLTNDIGAKWSYSNVGGGLLGHALALKAGTDYEALVIARICEPLEMQSTRLKLEPELQRRLAAPHDHTGKPTKNWDIPTLSGAGALRSTANDMIKFVAANLDLSKTPLAVAMHNTHSERTNTTSSNLYVCLGWHLTRKHGREIIWHNGETGGYHCFVAFDKRARSGVVVLANFTHWIDDIGFHLLDGRFELDKSKPKS